MSCFFYTFYIKKLRMFRNKKKSYIKYVLSLITCKNILEIKLLLSYLMRWWWMDSYLMIYDWIYFNLIKQLTCQWGLHNYILAPLLFVV